MASRARESGWPAGLFSVLLCVSSAVHLNAQLKVGFVATDPMPLRGAVETSATDVPASADALIEQMVRAAGVVFAGQVTSVRRPVGRPGSGEGVVEVVFRVNQAVRGPAAGSVYMLREWAGLWTGSSRRYRIGQRLLVFLYTPNAHGFSSPVHGAEGAMPLRGGGIAPGPDDAFTGVAEWNVDLHWVQAQVLRDQRRLTLSARTPPYPRPVRGSTPEFVEGQGAAEFSSVLSRRLPEPSPLTASAHIQTEPLSHVVALCRRAMKEDAMSHRDGIR